MTLNANAMRPGLGPLRALWTITFYEADDSGEGRRPDGRRWTEELEAHPRLGQRLLAHQVWLHLNRENPDLPELDLLNPQVQHIGYCDANSRARVHGARCTACGSSRVMLTTHLSVRCACGTSQTLKEAQLCTDTCTQCKGKTQ